MIMRIRLLSDSCAQGWASWGHGELWLTEDALVRVGKRAPASPVLKALAAGAPANEELNVKWDSWAYYLATHDDVQVLAYEQIAEAKLKAGLATTSLAVRLRQGMKIRFLWRRTPGSLQALRAVLP
jgi:hypothetical protein